MPPAARDEELELHGSPPALTASLFGEVEERPADTDAALLGSRGQHPEFARNRPRRRGADDRPRAAVAGGDDDLAGRDQRRELGDGRPRRALPPQSALGDGRRRR